MKIVVWVIVLLLIGFVINVAGDSSFIKNSAKLFIGGVVLVFFIIGLFTAMDKK